ncbi:hypothetical protein [Kibdelosporangium phytohabitans]|uniref:hypothetical protein n=1 Tax=Kibdelosporangium phytohabitans TaxID=860235 RepID=UPI0019FBFBCC|nr:hypothetical protein [Kibdelosporangium phytohabitans]MBE1470071.1 hypothetical protein [Kibdelosporangium phytohabitans]
MGDRAELGAHAGPRVDGQRRNPCAPRHAFTSWARLPRLTADVEGTAVFAALAVLSEHPEPLPEVTATAVPDGVEIRWLGRTTRVEFTDGGVRVN